MNCFEKVFVWKTDLTQKQEPKIGTNGIKNNLKLKLLNDKVIYQKASSIKTLVWLFFKAHVYLSKLLVKKWSRHSQGKLRVRKVHLRKWNDLILFIGKQHMVFCHLLLVCFRMTILTYVQPVCLIFFSMLVI